MENPQIDFPFDEADGSTVAYDLGPNMYVANIEYGRFVPGLSGNCVYFPKEGKAEVFDSVFDFTQDFTVTFWVKTDQNPPGPKHSGVAFKFPGEGNTRIFELFTTFPYWQNVTIVQDGMEVAVYVDSKRKAYIALSEFMTGFMIFNDSPHKKGGFASFESFKIFDRALSPDEIVDHIEQTYRPVNTYINGTNLADLGVTVEEYVGILNRPGLKDPLTVNWPDYHGEIVDLKRPRRQFRDFTIRCNMKATTKDALVESRNAVLDLFDVNGLCRVQIDAGEKPLFFEAFIKEEIEIKNRWRNIGPYFAWFDLVFREPEPVKRVLKLTGNSCSITLTCPTLLTVTWGDGAVTNNVRGTALTINHSYVGSGTYYVVITGNIEDISSFSTSASVVWNRAI